MAQLHRTLYSLKKDGLVLDWSPRGPGNAPTGAIVRVTPEYSICVVIGDDFYMVNLADIVEVHRLTGKIDFVIVNAWQIDHVSQQAEEFCRRHLIPIVTYNDFRNHLHAHRNR